jgi:hypothetical protein
MNDFLSSYLISLEKTGGLFDIDGTLPALMLQFAIFVQILRILLFQHLQKILQQREDEIENNFKNGRISLDDVEELQKKIKKLLEAIRRITSLRVERLQRRLQSLSFQSKVSLESQRVDFYEENLKNYNPTSDVAYNLGVQTLQRLESYLKQRLI